ncbi:MAG: pyridoxamine 5'-phosphate oxidase family protein [Mangrovicoccus sp.]
MTPLTLDDLTKIYGTPAAAATKKVATALTDDYRAWIEASRFCVLTTVGPEGTDGSPRGDDGPVVRELSPTQLALPDWRGNDRIDSLRNIALDGRVSLMFMVPGKTNVIRINGRAFVTADAELCASFAFKGKEPRTVIVIDIAEIYFQCARALIRSQLWGAQYDEPLPSPGQILAGLTQGEVGGEAYDKAWPERAAKTMW